jgi:hypothetical protein
LPEVFLYLPEVGGLTGEGGTVDFAKGREPLCVVTAEEEMDAFVGVETEELADHFDGEDLRIGKLRSGTALTDATPFEPVVDKAEDGHDEGAKIHKKTSVMFGAIGLTPSVGRSSLWLKSSRETCTRGYLAGPLITPFLLLLTPPIPGHAPRLVHIEHQDREQHHRAANGVDQCAPERAEIVTGRCRTCCYVSEVTDYLRFLYLPPMQILADAGGAGKRAPQWWSAGLPPAGDTGHVRRTGSAASRSW